MLIKVQTQDFDAQLISDELSQKHPETGAVVQFVGKVRDTNLGKDVTGLRLEHYPGMTEKVLTSIAKEACKRWEIIDLAIVHRVGDLEIGDNIVLVLVLSAHRKDAFEACSFLMDYLKSKAPFWKLEESGGGKVWLGV